MTRAAEYRKGSDTELLHIGGGDPTKLSILCGDKFHDSRVFKSGDLSIHSIRVSESPVSMVSCMVGCHHWMLARDSMAFRATHRVFVLAFPGFVYGLTFPRGSHHHEDKKLEEIFIKFSNYQDLALKDDSEANDLWGDVYMRIEKLAIRTTGKILAPAESSSTDGKSSSHLEVVARKMQRAVRTSAMVKLVSRSLLNGVLNPTKHLMLIPVKLSNDASQILPSVSVLMNLLDAIYSGCWSATTARPSSEGFWYLNREGLVLLLTIVKSYGAIDARSSKKPRLDVVEEAESQGGVGGGGAAEGRGEGFCGGGGGRGEEVVEKRIGMCGGYSYIIGFRRNSMLGFRLYHPCLFVEETS